MSSYRTEAIILKRINFGEADRILTIFTKHYGKIKAIAKGVRKVTSRKGGSLELFNHCALFLAEGRNLDILTEAQVINSFPAVREDLKRISQAYCIVELVDQLTPERQANRQLFDLLVETLAKLSNCPTARLITDFQRELLETLGFWSEKLEKERDLRYYIENIIERKLRSPDFYKDQP